MAHPSAATLLEASLAAARALDDRVVLISHIRADTAKQADTARQRVAAATDAAAGVASAASAAAAPPRQTVAAPSPSTVPGAVTASSAPPAVPVSAGEVSRPAPARTSSVQVIFLGIGITLLSIGAITFLVYAFVTYGLLARSIIIGTVTIATIVAATILKKRLGATAEGLATFAVVLIYLDAFAVRANDLAGTASVEGALFWGITIVVASGLFAVWHHTSGLRVPGLAAHIGVGPGAGLLAVAVTDGLATAMHVTVVALAIAVAGLLHATIGRVPRARTADVDGTPERAILLVTTAVALVIASIAAFSSERSAGDAVTAPVSLALVAIVAVVHILVLARLRLPRDEHSPSGARPGAPWHPLVTVFAVVAGLDLATLGFASVAHSTHDDLLVSVAPVAALAVALAAEVLWRRTRTGAHARATTAALVSTVVSTAALFAAPVGFAVFASIRLLAGAIAAPWSVDVTATVTEPTHWDIPSLGALGAAVVLVAGAWIGLARAGDRRRGAALVWGALAVAALAVPLLESLPAILAAYFALAAGSLAVAIAGRRRVRARDRVILAAIAVVSTVCLWITGWLALGTWPVVAAAAVALAVAARGVAPTRPTIAALSTGTMVLLLLTSAGATALHLTSALDVPTLTRATDATRFSSVAAIVLVTLAALLPSRRVQTLERRTAFWLGLPVAVGAGVVLSPAWLGGTTRLVPPAVDAVVAAALVAAVVAWALARTLESAFVERVLSGAIIAPALLLATVTITTAADASDVIVGASAAGAATLVAAAALVASLRIAPDDPRIRTIARSCHIGVGAVALGVLAHTVGADARTAWIVLALSAATALMLALVRTVPSMSAALVAAATALLLSAVGALATDVVRAIEPTGSARADAALAALAASAAAIALTLLPPRAPTARFALSTLDRRAIFWVAFACALLTATLPALSIVGVSGDRMAAPLVVAAVYVGVLAALTAFLARRTTRAARVERVAASVALAPVVFLVLASSIDVVDPGSATSAIIPALAALITAVAALAWSARSTSTSRPPVSRGAIDTGAALVAAPAALVAIIDYDGASWFVLVLLAIALLVVAVSADGLLASRSRRHQLGWAALAVAVAGLWLKLGDESVVAVEAYTLPVAGAVLLIAALLERERPARAHLEHPADPRGADATAFDAAPTLTLVGLVVAILPLAIVASDGSLVRAVVVFVASAALLLAASLATATGRPRPFLDAAAIAAALGVVVVSLGRAIVESDALIGAELDRSFTPEAWLVPAVAVAIVSAYGLSRERTDPAQPRRRVFALILALVTLVASVAVEWPLVAHTDTVVRALLVVLLLSAVHLVTALAAGPRLSTVLSLVSILAGVAIAGLAIAAGSADPLEVVTVPLAVALMASGATRLARDPDARSWPWLGPGVALLLVPSLLATLGDRPVWRLVALGVVSVIVLIAGVSRRLQAPFVIASAVVLIHAIATFTPQIRAAYAALPWPLWLTIGGAIVVALAARYEKRVANLKSAAVSVAKLR
ncbi:SCO7613 C-terminal domain-containing membrane protein [Marisediminicola sp. LYQ85]|uniref:SCO7613 C-terminal domain-containing membrane protein n=1 Tax=Marisediminicola sp. LYQ85 TaxID=3391062 RepID=UPI003983A19C